MATGEMQNASGQRGCYICSTKQQTVPLQQEGRKGLIPEVVLYPSHEHPDIRFTEPTNTHPTQTFVKLFKNDTSK